MDGEFSEKQVTEGMNNWRKRTEINWTVNCLRDKERALCTSLLGKEKMGEEDR